MATPPTLVDESEGVWSHTGTSETIAGVDTGAAAGRALVVLAASADSPQTVSNPTGGSLTYTLAQSNVISSNSNTYVWTAIPATNQTFSLGLTGGSNGAPWSANVLTFSGSDGIGASSKGNSTGGPSLAITTTAANSAILVIVADWNAVSGASRTWRTVNGITPTSGNGLEKTYFTDGSNYTVYAALYNDAGTAGLKTVGLSAPTGQKYTIIAVEVKGTTAAGGSVTLDANASAAGSAGGTIAVAKVLTGPIPAASSAAGATSVARPFNSTSNAASSATGQLSLTKTLSGISSAAATPTALLGTARPLTGTSAASSSATADLTIAGQTTLAGQATTASSATGALSTSRPMSGQASSAASVTTTLAASRSLNAMASAAASVSGDLVAVSDTILDGATTAASSATGSLTTGRLLSALLTAASSATGTAVVARQFAGIGSNADAVTGMAVLERPLLASLEAASSATGLLQVTSLIAAEPGRYVSGGGSIAWSSGESSAVEWTPGTSSTTWSSGEVSV